MFCPKCGSKLQEGAVFCGNCGFRIGGSGVSAIYGAPEVVRLEKAPQAAPSKRWPPVIGILMAAALAVALFVLIEFMIDEGQVFKNFLYLTVFSLLSMVLFFVPTRQVPVVTAIPRILYCILNTVFLIQYLMAFISGYYYYTTELFIVLEVVNYVLFTLAPTALYIIGVTVKPRSIGIAVAFMVLVFLSAVDAALSFNFSWDPFRGYSFSTYTDAYTLCRAAIWALTGAGYGIALLLCRGEKTES